MRKVHTSKIQTGIWLASMAIASLLATSALAAASGPIEIVTVTAEKRAEDVQKVPIAISAISGDTLDTSGIIGTQDLGMHVPSLRFGSGVTGGENVITLRGFSSQNTTSGGDSPVAYSVDGVTMARTTAVDPEFFDVNRIEVLRGPQGTLYGRNSVGGAINIITNKPDNEFGAYADALFGNYSAWTLRGWANLPLTHGDGGTEVDARVTGVWSQHDPYQKNFSTAPTATHNADGQDFYMVRGQVYFEFSDNVNLLLSGTTTHNGDGVATKLAWGTAPAFAQGRFIGQTYDPDPRHVTKDFPEVYDQKNNFLSATLNWNLGGATLTSITAYTDGKWNASTDADSVALDLAHNNFWTLNSRQYSEEIRLASNDDQKALRWIAGFFYLNEDVKQTFFYQDTGVNAAFFAFDFDNGGTIKTTSWAPFGQIDLDLSKTSMAIPLTITAGVRYSHDQKHIDDFLNFNSLFGGFSLAKNISKSWSQVTGKLGLAYQANDNTMLYANVSRGYLAGGELVGNFPGVYNPETVMNYEAGFKSTFAGDRIQLNGAAYYTNIRDMQVFVQDITGSRIDNAGKAHVEGIELEATAVPVDNLRLNASVALTEAKYDEYKTIDNRYLFAGLSPCFDPFTNPAAICDFKGHRLIQTPEYTVDLGGEYTFDTSIGTITPRADVFFSGDVFFLSANTPRDRQSAYTLTNFHLTWNSTNGKWMADAFVNNAFDKDVISNDGLQSATIGLGFGIDNYTYYAPRTFGLRVGVHL
ncbi:MAG: TonB-dependent receptor [Proteobacteria bacterium]|nr:TonB-dependent receptor [Pseudomonadota bacterium]